MYNDEDSNAVRIITDVLQGFTKSKLISVLEVLV